MRLKEVTRIPDFGIKWRSYIRFFQERFSLENNFEYSTHELSRISYHLGVTMVIAFVQFISKKNHFDKIYKLGRKRI